MDDEDWEDDDEDAEVDDADDEAADDALELADDAADEAAEEAAADAACVTAAVTVCCTTKFDGHGVANIDLTHLSTSPLANCEYVKILEVPLIITNTPDVD